MMITVTVRKDCEGVVREFRIQGHAGFDEEGQDIVCSAVSAVSYTALGGLLNLVDPDIPYNLEGGWIYCTLPKDLTDSQVHDANVILQAMLIGFLSIAREYSEYVRVIEEEV